MNYDISSFDGNEDGAFDEEGEDILELLEEGEEEITCCPNCNGYSLQLGLVWFDKKLIHVITCLGCGYVSDPQYDEWAIAG